MKKLFLCTSLLSVSLSGYTATLIHNVKGYTLNDGKLTTFTAIEFDQGKVTQLYQDKSSARSSKAENKVNANGQVMLPGLIDAHGHVLSHGKALSAVALRDTKNEADAVKRVLAFMMENPQFTWVQGRGWNQELWDKKSFPTAASLDVFSASKPVALSRVDGHALWVNSEALKRAGISKDTPDPDGGKIIRDKDGNPTGVLIDNAMEMVFDIIPSLTNVEMEAVLIKSMNDLASYGLTSVHDAGIYLDNLAA